MGLEHDVSPTAARQWYENQIDLSMRVNIKQERPIVRDFYDWASSIIGSEMATEPRWKLLTMAQREQVALTAAKKAVAALENSLFESIPEGRR